MPWPWSHKPRGDRDVTHIAITSPALSAWSVRDLLAERDALAAQLTKYKDTVDDLSACICGCPIAEHESRAEDGESCGNDNHECLRVFPAVAAMLKALLARLATQEQAALKGRKDADAAVRLLAEALRDLHDAAQSHMDYHDSPAMLRASAALADPRVRRAAERES